MYLNGKSKDVFYIQWQFFDFLFKRSNIGIEYNF